MGLVLIALERTTICLMQAIMVGIITIGRHVTAFIALFPTHRKHIFPPLKKCTKNIYILGYEVHVTFFWREQGNKLYVYGILRILCITAILSKFLYGRQGVY